MDSSDVLKGLNERQKEAVTTTEGRVRVIAGAGSGKTRALAHRYAYLVNKLGIDPSNILCVTFTNKAAREMAQRISTLVDKGYYNDFVCTFHGFCLKVLKREIYRIGYPKSFTILDEADSKQLAKEVFEELGMERNKSTIQRFLTGLALYKSSPSGALIKAYIPYMLSGYELSDNDKTDPNVSFLQKQLKLFALDFQDLICFAMYILATFKEAREYWQNELNYIMVDEAQDCSSNEWSLVELLSEKYQNLFIVGDPDQLIYGWRGVSLEPFIHFKCDSDIIMDENYRSTSNILDVANSIIVNNQNRIEKNLFTNHGNGQQVIHFHGKNEGEESDWIVKQISSLIEKTGAKNSDFAILYRASYLSRAIEESLMKARLQYTIWGGTRFFERKEIKDSLSYLRLIAYGDDLSFSRIANVPSRKIGKVFMARLKAIAEEEGTPLYDTLKRHKDDEAFHKDSVDRFIQLIEDSRDAMAAASVSGLLNNVLISSGLKDELRNDGDEDRLENVAELLNSIKYYEEVNKEEDISLESYLQDIALFTNADYKNDSASIKLMTIHQAKGLEFPFVFVIGLSEGILPNYRSIRERKKEGEEEERRLMYVAVTRAEKALFLTESEGFTIATKTDKYPSRFIREIKEQFFVTEGHIDDELWQGTDLLIQSLLYNTPEPAKEYRIGDMVHHDTFGQGVVIEVNEERKSCQVSFDHTIRSILFTHLTKNNEEFEDDDE